MKNYKRVRKENQMIPEQPQAVREKRGRMERLRQVKSIADIPGQSPEVGPNANAPME
jgi:hypothetical protein